MKKKTFRADFGLNVPPCNAEAHETIFNRDGTVEHSSKEAEASFNETAKMCRKFVEGWERAASKVHDKFNKSILEDAKPVRKPSRSR